MLLRRVIQHFRRQEWTAIGIDFVIVIVGVYIGIQAANWNEQRADEARAQEYLERIRSDLNSDLARYQNRIKFWGKVVNYGEAGLRFAEEGETANQTSWQIVLAYFQSSQLAEFVTSNSTFEELKSAGELNLIDSIELRDKLSDYYTYADNPVLTERPAYREHVRGVIPLDVQNYIWKNCYGSSFTGEQEMMDCPSPLSDGRAENIANQIARNQQLIEELRYWMSTMTVAMLIGRDRTDFAKRNVKLVEAELER